MRSHSNFSLQKRSKNASCSKSFVAGRWGAIVAGSALAAFGLSRRSGGGLAFALAGGGIALAGAKARPYLKPFSARASILVNCSPEEAFQRWQKFEDFPRFMRHLQSVINLGDGRYRWVAVGPADTPVQWDAQVATIRENELIEWHTLPNSQITVNGRVEFEQEPEDRGTAIRVEIEFAPPAGRLGYAITSLFGKNPGFIMLQDLRRFKALLEAGEVPTTEGQSHGARSARVAVLRLINPDRPPRKEARLAETFEAQRGIA
jgi:uncharacterized membrane protein